MVSLNEIKKKSLKTFGYNITFYKVQKNKKLAIFTEIKRLWIHYSIVGNYDGIINQDCMTFSKKKRTRCSINMAKVKSYNKLMI